MKLTAMAAALLALAGCVGNEFEGYGKRILTESVDIDAFDNAAFEDGTKCGPVGQYAEIGRFGVNGGGGLRLRPNKDRTIYFGLKLKGRLEKGKRYVYSADVRGHGKAGGSVALDTFFKGTNKSAPGCSAWGTISEKCADGWSHQHVDVVPKFEPEELEYKFIVYGKIRGTEPIGPDDYVDIDNFRIDLAGAKWYLCNTWPAYNLVHADEGRVRFNSSFLGDFFAPEAQPAYACELLAADGARLGRDVCEANANGNFTADFGELSYRGPAKLRVTLYDRQAREERGMREIDVTVAVPARDKNIFVKENGVVLRDGKPFMPLGFYTGLADAQKHDMKSVEHHLRRLHAAGFNVIMDYQCYSLQGKRRDEFYALAQKYGIGVIDDSFGPGTARTLDKNREAVAKRAREIAAYPAHIGWYTMDEAPEDAVPGLGKLRRLLNKAAPGKIVNTCNIMRAAPYLPTADIQGGDSYPVKKRADASLTDPHSRVSKVRACEPAAIWYAPQCYNWARMLPNRNEGNVYRDGGREPTMEEMLSVALCMVQDGTTGFLFYAYFDLIECPVAEWRESRWASMVEIAKVMRDLEPFIMSGEEIVDLPHADKAEETRVTALSDGKGARRVIVCGLNQRHEATFTLPSGFDNLKSRLGHVTCRDGVYTFKGGAFSCDVLE